MLVTRLQQTEGKYYPRNLVYRMSKAEYREEKNYQLKEVRQLSASDKSAGSGLSNSSG